MLSDSRDGNSPFPGVPPEWFTAGKHLAPGRHWGDPGSPPEVTEHGQLHLHRCDAKCGLEISRGPTARGPLRPLSAEAEAARNQCRSRTGVPLAPPGGACRHGAQP